MVDITLLPKEELEKDLLDSIEDIGVCLLALYHEIHYYSGGSVAERLASNRRIVRIISAELKRREEKQRC